jgi:hypothetical protein
MVHDECHSYIECIYDSLDTARTAVEAVYDGYIDDFKRYNELSKLQRKYYTASSAEFARVCKEIEDSITYMTTPQDRALKEQRLRLIKDRYNNRRNKYADEYDQLGRRLSTFFSLFPNYDDKHPREYHILSVIKMFRKFQLNTLKA